jgi:hypothetical protein
MNILRRSVAESQETDVSLDNLGVEITAIRGQIFIAIYLTLLFDSQKYSALLCFLLSCTSTHSF